MTKTRKAIINLILCIIFLLPFLWIHSFVHITSFDPVYRNASYGIIAGTIIVLTIMVYTVFSLITYIIDDLAGLNTLKNTLLIAAATLIMIIVWFFDRNMTQIAVYQTETIQIGGFELQKESLFVMTILIIFPTLVRSIFRVMRKENFTKPAIILGFIQIALISAIELTVFYSLPIAYCVLLALFNIIAIICELYRCISKRKNVNRTKGIAFGAGYFFIWVIASIMRLNSNGSFLTDDTQWQKYTNLIHQLMKNANLLGTSSELLSMTDIHIWLFENTNYIHQLMFYGGWVVVIGLLITMLGFLCVLFPAAKDGNNYLQRNYPVYLTAYTWLSIRTILGTLYSFGLFPLTISLPFENATSLITDSIAFALLFKSLFEKYRIAQTKTYTLVKASELLGSTDNLLILDENFYPYVEEDLSNNVLIKGKNKRLSCHCEWFDSNNDNCDWVVFEPDKIANTVFILKYDGNNWIEESIENCQGIFTKYLNFKLSIYTEDKYE